MEFLEVEESSISEADLELIVAIVAATTSPPASFAAIRNSRKWGEEKKSVLYLRNALSQLMKLSDCAEMKKMVSAFLTLTTNIRHSSGRVPVKFRYSYISK